MARKMRPDIQMGPETDQALARVTELAHRLAAGLAGEELSAEGRAETPRAAALASAMIYFLLRISPEDHHALFVAEGSIGELPFKPLSPRRGVPPALAEFL